MTKLELVDDAIKIGLPSLITAVTAIRIARATRSHELEKERFRRRQDALEKISDDFQAGYSSLVNLWQNFHTYVDLRGDSAGRFAFLDLQKSKDAMEAALRDLYLIKGRLSLLKLEKCEKAFLDYVDATTEFRSKLKLPPHPDVPTKEQLKPKFDKVRLCRTAFEDSLADAFDSLSKKKKGGLRGKIAKK